MAGAFGVLRAAILGVGGAGVFGDGGGDGMSAKPDGGSGEAGGFPEDSSLTGGCSMSCSGSSSMMRPLGTSGADCEAAITGRDSGVTERRDTKAGAEEGPLNWF